MVSTFLLQKHKAFNLQSYLTGGPQLAVDSFDLSGHMVTLQLNVVQQAVRHSCVAVSRGSYPTF